MSEIGIMLSHAELRGNGQPGKRDPRLGRFLNPGNLHVCNKKNICEVKSVLNATLVANGSPAKRSKVAVQAVGIPQRRMGCVLHFPSPHFNNDCIFSSLWRDEALRRRRGYDHILAKFHARRVALQFSADNLWTRVFLLPVAGPPSVGRVALE